MELIEVRKIWDEGAHNAFTDLIYFNNQWHCAFREAEDHLTFDGGIRLLSSKDGKEWLSVTLLKSEEGDIRDPKFSITPNGQLMLNAGIRLIEAIDGAKLKSVVWFSSDGMDWSDIFSCSTNHNTWRWSTTWNNNIAYSFAYSGKHKQGCLYSSEDGKSWQVHKDDVYPFDEKTKGNETSLIFLKRSGKAFCLLRRDRGSYQAMLGSSNPPYTKWKWKNMKVPLGGPKMIAITQNRFLAAVRLYDKEVRTSLCWINPKSARLKEVLKLPSGGDCSYSGLVYKDGIVWMSYYSSHEDKSAIYLAKVKL